MICWFSLETNELQHTRWFFFSSWRAWGVSGSGGIEDRRGGEFWWCLTECGICGKRTMSGCTSDTDNKNCTSQNSKLQWAAEQTFMHLTRNRMGKVERKVWKGKSNKEQSRSLHVTKCTSLGSMIYFLVRQNKKSSPMVLSGVRELNLVMSIWPFGPLQAASWCAGNGVWLLQTQGKIPVKAAMSLHCFQGWIWSQDFNHSSQCFRSYKQC